MPTPTTQDAANTAGPSQLRRNSLPLNTLVTTLSSPPPTPRHTSTGSAATPNSHGPSKHLHDEAN